jgi:2-polyprenyl-6-methoxyphenol hydroxylase-like FAD-dependent oxidoreductase
VLIERVLRDKVRLLPNVTIGEDVTVQGLELDDGAVTGVRLQQGSSEPELIETGFVVDALGRGSSVTSWLAEAGWAEPPVKTLDAKVTYVSRWYDLPSAEERPESWWWKHIVVMPTVDTDPNRPDEHSYLSNFFPIDGNRAIACMGSWGLDMPRTTEDFTLSAKRLRTPLFASAMEQSTPTSEVHLTRSTGNVWKRYDKVDGPAGLVYIGDSICAFNPFYAQGMSSASMSAVLLKESLEKAPTLDRAFARRFTKDQVALLKVPWTMAMARDQGYECGTGTETVSRWRQRLTTVAGAKAFALITGAAREDEVIDEHFAKVFNLDESLGDMFRSPRVLYGLLRQQVRTMLGRTTIPYGFDPMQDPPADDYTPKVAS